MSVLIKGMKMPKNCEDCRFEDFGGCMFRVKRSDCPLVEVPTPHGRLIDADELLLRSVSGTEIYHISAAPTIIEAEEGEEE